MKSIKHHRAAMKVLQELPGLSYCIVYFSWSISSWLNCHQFTFLSRRMYLQQTKTNYPLFYLPTRSCNCAGYLAPTISIFFNADSMLFNSAALNRTSIAPIFSRKRCNFVVPGMGTIHGF